MTINASPLVLITNDDGINAEGIIALHNVLKQIAKVVVVAPSQNRSACSHSITVRRPVRHQALSADRHGIDGTPADCVYFALHSQVLAGERPNLVLSGINHGPNLGIDTHYSGTVAGAREAVLRGIPAIAVSSCQRETLEQAAAIAARVAKGLLHATQPPGHPVCLNINVPPNPHPDLRVTSLHERYQAQGSVPVKLNHAQQLWAHGPSMHEEAAQGSDIEAVQQGYVSVTPLRLQSTFAEHIGIAAYASQFKPEETA